MGSFRVSEEKAAIGLQQAEQRDQHRGSCPPPCTPQPRTCIHGVHGGWVLKAWASVDSPGERTGLCCTETVWRRWSVVWAAIGSRHRTDPGSAIGATLLMGAKRGGALHSSLVLSTSLAGTAPLLWVLGACKHQRVVPTPRWGWNLSPSQAAPPHPNPAPAQLQKQGWNLSHLPVAVLSQGFMPCQ